MTYYNVFRVRNITQPLFALGQRLGFRFRMGAEVVTHRRGDFDRILSIAGAHDGAADKALPRSEPPRSGCRPGVTLAA